jgi:hypothetical protein
VSAMQKAIRRSKVKESVYWAMELYISGYDAWMWARLQEICSEDIGPADRNLPATLQTLREWSNHKKKTKGAGGMEAVHAVILLATAPKSGIACWMVMEATGDNAERFEIPDEALDQHTRKGRQMGRGHEHFVEEGQVKVQPEDRALMCDFASVEAMLFDLEAEGLKAWKASMDGKPMYPKNAKGEKAVAEGDSYLPPAAKDVKPSGDKNAEKDRVKALFE